MDTRQWVQCPLPRAPFHDNNYSTSKEIFAMPELVLIKNVGFILISRSDYNALTTKDPNVFYFIYDT